MFGIKNKKGFSLMEMLMVIAIIGVLIFVGLPSYNTMRDGIALKNNSHEIVNALRVAQRRSVVSQGGTTHGVRFTSSTYTLFDGDPASPVNEVEYKLAKGVSIVTPAPTIEFNRLTGDTDTAQTITVGTPGDSKNISVEKTGNIDIN